MEELAAQSSGGTSAGPSDRSRAEARRSRQTSPDSWESGETERFISEENISKVEDILDTWSNHLKVRAHLFLIVGSIESMAENIISKYYDFKIK